jgi:hypothetical protein
MLFGAVLSALAGGMFAGVGAYAARIHVTPGLDAKVLWLRGAMLAAVIIGVDAALATIAPDSAPIWPKYDVENTWSPWLGRALSALNILPLIGFLTVGLHWLDRMTAGWTRRRILAAVLLMLTEAAIISISADNWFDIAAGGLIGGAVSTLLFATVLRFDLRPVPALVAVYVSVMVVAQSLQKGTAQAALLAAIGVASTLAVAWGATRYVLAAGPVALPGTPAPGDLPAAAVDAAAE